MKIVHMADSHLGHMSFNKIDRNGRNLMEQMVYEGFESVMDRILKIKPDAVVHAGDVFHHVRPRIQPLYVFKCGLERLVEAGIPVVVISGNHDSPKSKTAFSPFYMYEGIRDVHIAHKNSYERFEIDGYNFHCIPFCIGPEDYLEEYSKIELQGQDVLVMHGLVESLRNQRLKTVGEHELRDSFLKSDLDYIALGHFHGQTQISENAWYSGSVEYFNFGEAHDKKGILLVDLESGNVTPIEIHKRYMVDCLPVDCSGMSSADVMDEIENLCSDCEGKIMRITLQNLDRAVYRRVDLQKVNRLVTKAIYLKIQPVYADDPRTESLPKLDTIQLPDEFGKFVVQNERGVPKSLQNDVLTYGTHLLQKVVAVKTTEDMNASQ